MSKVRLLVGARKGAFVMTADGTRDDWDVQGPLFTGWEMYHLKGSPADPKRLYASQSTGWHGQVMQRSDDGGKNWETVGNEFAYDGVPGTHQWYDGTQHPWEFARVWHLEPSLDDPDTVYAGVEDAALFKSTDGGDDARPALGRLVRGNDQPACGLRLVEGLHDKVVVQRLERRLGERMPFDHASTILAACGSDVATFPCRIPRRSSFRSST